MIELDDSRCTRNDVQQPRWPGLLVRILLAIVLGTSFWCGGDGNGGPLGPAAEFSPSGTVVEADQVRLTGSVVSSDTIRVNVVIHGPTTTSDLYSFAFDLLLGNPDVASYIHGSASAGDALTPGSGQGMSVMVSQQGDRVVVGVSKTGGGTGNQAPAGDHVLVSMEFRVPNEGVTTLRLAGSPSNPQNPTDDPAALDSAGRVIQSVVFEQPSALISR